LSLEFAQKVLQLFTTCYQSALAGGVANNQPPVWQKVYRSQTVRRLLKRHITEGEIYRMRKILFFALSPLYLLLIFGAPFAICASLYLSAPLLSLRLLVLFVAPILYSVLYLLIAALLSLPHQSAIIAGRFPRDIAHPIYFHRRLYGLCWTTVYYFVPIYHLALSLPFLKTVTFRLFGYRGHMGFTTYPDTWIRDLPLLRLGKGAYLSNKSTIGTNIAFPDGSILVESVTVEEGALVGHLAMLAPGVEIRKGAEIGVGARIGLKSIIGEGAKINPCCSIEHGVKIGAHSKIGAVTYIASAVTIAPDIVIPAGVTIPARTRIRTQEEAQFFAGHIEAAKLEKKSWGEDKQELSRFPLSHL
jgi:carbonic anhydrase/acetyltransferase-like protein (isoleucine patch superfamily)